MFTSFSLSKNRPLTEEQKHRFHELLEVYSHSRQGQWLSDIPFHQFEIRWCDAMTPDSGVMGAFVPWLGRKVFLMPTEPPLIKGMADPWPEQIAPTLVHELRHAWQYQKYKILYIFCCLPGLREITLERDAWKITNDAQRFFSECEKTRCAAKFAARQKERK
ncbi:MAG: hypothetical protein PHH77_03525 [Victivallaceae bacterium]|nr:hypothetical protein [Victivallaceae bacterium]